ncbi:MAG: hypothetical protein KGP28_11925 [Bdellovibrionales bacterium]|nr:hypothetical protein [Bdellovibrionales bacterium]
MKNLMKWKPLMILIFGLMIPLLGEAKSLPNRSKHLRADLKKCQSEVKRLSSLGYPEKAEVQLGKCQKIKGQLAKIEKGQMKVQRKLASLESGKKSKAHSKAKKKPKKKPKKKKKRVHSDPDSY